MTDTLGDYCKALERAETDRRGEIGLPIYVRIDGNRFSRFTKGMGRPFDSRMTRAMIETTKAIMEDYHAAIGYTQSDEISLVFYNAEHETHHGGKFQKLVSRMASKATAEFTPIAIAQGLGDFVVRRIPEFDARAFSVPSLEDAAKVLWWREIDATKNAIQMAAQTLFSHKALMNKNGDEMITMLADKGIVFEDYPRSFRLGTFVRRITEMRALTDDEMARIPEKHRPTGPVERHKLIELDLPPLRATPSMVDVLFPATPSEPVTRRKKSVEEE